MALALIWLTWKIYPLLKTHGGIKGLFHLQPLKKGPDVVEEVKENVEAEDVKTQRRKRVGG